MPFLGELAALGTALCWSVTSILFTIAVRRIGAFSLNLARLTAAAVLLVSASFLFHGAAWFLGARPREMVYLIISGWVGLTLGDWAYFHAMRLMGARLATLMMSLAPAFTVLLGIPFLRELPDGFAILAMAITGAGVCWVVLGRGGRTADGSAPEHHRVRGSLLGALGSLAQAGGLILSKAGMAGGMSPLPATAIRLTAGCAGVWAMLAFRRREAGLAVVRHDRNVRLVVGAASVLGPGLRIWLSLVAVKHTQAGIAATIMSTVPVLVLPLVILVFHERVSWRAALGACVAVAGVGLLFLRR